MSTVDSLKALFAPGTCPVCAAPAPNSLPCTGCRADLPWNRPCCPRCAQPQSHAAPCARCAQHPAAFDSAWAAFKFDGAIRHSVVALKYHAHFLQAHVLGELMGQTLTRRAQPLPQLILPVPLHPRRLRLRGYNQALELARVIALSTGIRVDALCALRVKNTEDQIGKTAAQRRNNVKGAFQLRRRLDGLHIALLDDVMTTGATLDELARVCRKGGAAKIEAWAAARAP